MGINRRNLLKAIGITGGAAAITGIPKEALVAGGEGDFSMCNGVLVDLSLCIGCRACEKGCNIANKLPEPDVPFEDQEIFGKIRKTDDKTYTVVNKFKPGGSKEPVYVKRQCMHCNEPACSSVCLVAALKKSETGAVNYDPNLCLGCRYCMVACPFEVPKYEYHKALKPRVRKCTFCFHLISRKGGVPGCVQACPTGTLTFGNRDELLKVARERIVLDKAYVDHIYGQHEVGGTSWMYISKVPFGELGFPMTLGNRPYPEKTYGYLWNASLVYFIWPTFLIGAWMWSKRREQVEAEDKKIADADVGKEV